MAAMDTGRSMVTRVAVEELESHLATLETELSDGRAIELVRGETVIAEVRAKQTPVAQEPHTPRPMPDFMARLKEIWGDRVFPEGYMTGMIRRDRDGEN